MNGIEIADSNVPTAGPPCLFVVRRHVRHARKRHHTIVGMSDVMKQIYFRFHLGPRDKVSSAFTSANLKATWVCFHSEK